MPAKLVLIGDGPDRGAAEFLVRKHCLQKDVFFLGKQDNVYEKLSVSDLFLLPSQLESFGLAALEAMACEVPVIATNVGGVPEVVTHGVDGFWWNPAMWKERALRHRDSVPRRPRPRNGQNRPHQRQEKLLRQRRHPRLRKLLQARPRRILMEH